VNGYIMMTLLLGIESLDLVRFIVYNNKQLL
jgi:hypothetical protein